MSDYGGYQSIEEYDLKKQRPTYRYIALAVLFLICSITLGWMIGDLAVHMRTGYNEPLHISDVQCIAGGKAFAATNGVCVQ